MLLFCPPGVESLATSLTVMTSFNNMIISACGNWFQTNPLEHESDDRANNAVLCVALQRQI